MTSYTDIVIVLNPTGSSRPGHLYIGARRGRPGIDWDWANWVPYLFSIHTKPHLVWLIFTFEIIWCPLPPILSPSSRRFAELTLVTYQSAMIRPCSWARGKTERSSISRPTHSPLRPGRSPSPPQWCLRYQPLHTAQCLGCCYGES
jgi:hypothetical protein